MKDHRTNTEADAAKADRMTAYETDDRERDEPGTNAADHDCSLSPHPETCMGCMAFIQAQELAFERRCWDEYKRSQRDDEEAAS